MIDIIIGGLLYCYVSPCNDIVIYSVLIMVFLLLVYYLQHNLKPLRFSKTHVIIIGGSSGLGRELAKELFFQGNYITVIARKRDRLLELHQELEYSADSSGRGRLFQLFDFDLSTEEKFSEVVAKAEKSFGHIELFISCIGTVKGGYFIDCDMHSFEEQMKNNYFSLVKALNPVSKNMCKRKKGRICLVGSSHSYMPLPGMSAWSCSKAAVAALAYSIRAEMAKYNVKVHLFSPGPMDTPGLGEARTYRNSLIDRFEGTPLSTEAAVKLLLGGMALGNFHITTSWFDSLLKGTAAGGQIRDFLLFDLIFAWISTTVGHCYAHYVQFNVIREKRNS